MDIVNDGSDGISRRRGIVVALHDVPSGRQLEIGEGLAAKGIGETAWPVTRHWRDWLSVCCVGV